jgi:hypothetical protein
MDVRLPGRTCRGGMADEVPPDAALLLRTMTCAFPACGGQPRSRLGAAWLHRALLMPCGLGCVFIAHAADGSTGDDVLGSAFGVAVHVGA